ncbi:RagB/SusD family nutrient uptake outer membrane protein [Parabacteroides sp. BX2]|uniref:RagB/SusD family nutrient uptake outer membrane protein n=1 Tax=Parabacteroides segnis TaxID=2763058 RepID=A0ABR7E3V7_9BACT|nr:RagB/SusD family nutrient uptake outer membrane protein [Parabacteroides segnis]MBC5644416.1 RagB/SusD family nutrient uptake outer membrane protein [Parabacteroides segnis]
MKKIILSALLSACMLFPACSDFLDVSDELASNLTLEETFENVTYTRRWHAEIFNCISEYSQMFRDMNNDGLKNPWPHLCGETSTTYDKAQLEMVNGFNASNASFHRFPQLFKSIRQAYIFLERAKALGSETDSQKLTEEDIVRMKSEAKFFIAYSYFSLFELYGPVPIISEVVDESQSSFDYPRASVDEMISFIDNLYQEVLDENVLPITLRRVDQSTGDIVENMNEMVRPTKAVVLAMRAKLWVYAASKLFNGGYKEALELTNPDGKKLFPAEDKGKWETAKKHLETFLSFAKTEGYELFYATNKDGSINHSQSVYKVFQDYNNEIIWATGKTYMNEGNNEKHLDRRCRPRDILDGFAGIGVSQQMVDAFFTRNGLDIHEDPEYDETGFSDIENPCAYVKPQIDKGIFNMYVNREPRFYHAVTYQGKSWHIQPKAGWSIDLSKGGNNDDFNSSRRHYSGYYLYKRNNQELMNTGSYLRNYARPSIILRLADFYLYYAEVCNEINPSDKNIIIYLDKVRERAGIPTYQELHDKGIKKDVIGNYEAQAYAIRRERQVELFTEGQRYFDVRRWMICDPGEEADQTVYWGMNTDGSKSIAPGQPGSFFNRKQVRKHQWVRAMYLYPIPHNEVEISPSLVQNPLW